MRRGAEGKAAAAAAAQEKREEEKQSWPSVFCNSCKINQRSRCDFRPSISVCRGFEES